MIIQMYRRRSPNQPIPACTTVDAPDHAAGEGGPGAPVGPSGRELMTRRRGLYLGHGPYLLLVNVQYLLPCSGIHPPSRNLSNLKRGKNLGSLYHAPTPPTTPAVGSPPPGGTGPTSPPPAPR